MKNLIIFYFLSIAINGFSQTDHYLPNSDPFDVNIQSYLNKPESRVFTSIKPYRTSELHDYGSLDSTKKSAQISVHNKFNKGLSKWMVNKLFNEHLIYVNKDGLKLTIDPMVQLEVGREFVDKLPLSHNTRGVKMDGVVDGKFGFWATATENLSQFPTYVKDYISQNAVVPGMGMGRTNSVIGKYDYAYSTGGVWYQAGKQINLELGYDRNFIGDGYRSLLLSDVSFPYPYFKLTAKFWHVKYQVLYSQFIDMRSPKIYEIGYARKYTTSRYLDWQITPKLTMGLFETVVWQHSDRGLDMQYINPVLFLRPVEFSIASPDNVLMGINLSYKFENGIKAYAQGVLDEFEIENLKANDGSWRNKFGMQVGLFAAEPFGVKGVKIRTELNRVLPYTYSHIEPVVRNYAHCNQPLAHPMGANFREGLLHLSYQYKRLLLSGEVLNAIYGLDKDSVSYGKDIYKTYQNPPHEKGNFIGQGIGVNLWYANFTARYLINPNYNLNVFVSFSHRNELVLNTNKKANMLSFGVMCSVFSRYVDY